MTHTHAPYTLEKSHSSVCETQYQSTVMNQVLPFLYGVCECAEVCVYIPVCALKGEVSSPAAHATELLLSKLTV